MVSEQAFNYLPSYQSWDATAIVKPVYCYILSINFGYPNAFQGNGDIDSDTCNVVIYDTERLHSLIPWLYVHRLCCFAHTPHRNNPCRSVIDGLPNVISLVSEVIKPPRQ